VLQKRQQENNHLKLKEQYKNKELENCTFKPEINADYPLKDSDQDKTNATGASRVDFLYKLGIQIIKNKKDKPIEEFEVEKLKDCTFKPLIDKQDLDLSNHNSHYNDKENDKLADRLTKGRYEIKIKESVHERGVYLPRELPHSSSRVGKNDTSLRGVDKSSMQDKSINTKKNISKISKTGNNTMNESYPNLNSSNNMSDLKDSSINPDKKDAVPQLIIDVNIRPGVKKKICVYEGDTAEGLAEKFTKEHDLDPETKDKLKILIQNHMSKLLGKIIEVKGDEELNSINSEKSSTNNMLLSNDQA